MEGALPSGPARNSGVRGAVGDAGVDVPATKFDFAEVKIAAASELADQFLAAHTFGLQPKSSSGETLEAFRDSSRAGKLREIHAVELRADVIRRTRQKLCVDLCADFSATPLCVGVADFQMQVVERAFCVH